MTAAKVSSGVVAAASGAAVASLAPPEPSMWAIVVLGIPLGVLAAALVGAAIRHLRAPAQPDRRMVTQAFGTVADGFIGGWLAMLLIGLPSTNSYVGDVLRPEVMGALCALLVQFLRDYGKGYFDRLYDALLSRFFGSRAGDES